MCDNTHCTLVLVQLKFDRRQGGASVRPRRSMLLCLLASASGYMPYPAARAASRTYSNQYVHRNRQMCNGKMPLEIRQMQLADIPEAAKLLSLTFAPPGGYNAIQSAIVYKETVSGLTNRLNQTMLLCALADGVIVGSVEAFTPAFLSGKQIRFWNSSVPLETCGAYTHSLQQPLHTRAPLLCTPTGT